ncbi:50S ribosomal protein L21e [Candidatus Woesearchaeota archaeon]|nr:50S ribosomal protein L21e [Candidatus Woesearchaeota archaeon]
MAKRTGSTTRKARNKLTKPARARGKLSLTKYFAKFREGEKIILKAEPSVKYGMYHIRFHGKVGIIQGMQGKCYKVGIKDGSKQKTLIIHPVHLKRVA